jgi:hypothetical protein
MTSKFFSRDTSKKVFDFSRSTSFKFLVLVVLLTAILIVFLSRGQRSWYSLLDDVPGHVAGSQLDSSGCGAHCFRNADGKVADQYDCCECMATAYFPGGYFVGGEDQTASYDTGGKPSEKSSNYEAKFRGCMCKAGNTDFCYKESPNLLLG